MANEGYVDLGYVPIHSDLLTLFYMEPREGVGFEKAAEMVAGESSIGTWTDVSTSKAEIREKLKPSVYYINAKECKIKIAYPADLFEFGNMAGVLSSIAGNIFGMKAVQNLRLLDVGFPKDMVKEYRGPRHGIKGVRGLLKVEDRPLVGTIVKPKVGLDSREHAKVAYDAWVGGCDIVKDDENLTSQRFNKFTDRVIETLSRRGKAQDETKEKKIYMPNVSAEYNEMVERALFVKDEGCEYMMVDVVTIGFSALQALLKEKELDLVVHAHRAMHAALTRNKKHGISMLALAKIYRLLGVDQLHIGTIVGKMEGPKQEVVAIKNNLSNQKIEENLEVDILDQDWMELNTVFPVCSGGLHAGHIPEIVSILSKDIILQAGGGVHGHPDGTIAGAKSMRQAADAAMQGKTLGEYSKTHPELARALQKFK